MILELQRAKRVGDALDRIRKAVGEVVHRIDGPLVAGAVVVNPANPIHDRIAKIQVRRLHVDLRAQYVRAVLELPRPHPAEEVEVLFDRALPVRAFGARLVEVSAQLADFIEARAVDEREALFDQQDREIEKLLEIIGGEIAAIAPVETEPADVLLDRIDVLDVLGFGVGVVEAQVADASRECGRHAEVEIDRGRVADVKVAVGLRREARDDAPAVFSATHVRFDLFADEMRANFRGLLCARIALRHRPLRAGTRAGGE